LDTECLNLAQDLQSNVGQERKKFPVSLVEAVNKVDREITSILPIQESRQSEVNLLLLLSPQLPGITEILSSKPFQGFCSHHPHFQKASKLKHNLLSDQILLLVGRKPAYLIRMTSKRSKPLSQTTHILA
jgi:hypothetical protein